MAAAGDVSGLCRAEFDACGACDDQMRLGQFWKRSLAATPNTLVLGFEVLNGVFLLRFLLLLGAIVLGDRDKLLLQFCRCRQPLRRLSHILDMGGSIRPHLRGDEHALASTYHAPGIGGQFPPFATRIRSAGRVLDACDMSQRQLTTLMIAFQLRLNLARGIVEHQMITASATFSRLQFPASQTAQSLLLR
ncbi:hypothetical protein IA69_13005 [Massilia sp. JS1662]|nr:hypothetical protein IA69_13005 [Massilia sp. JS1662]